MVLRILDPLWKNGSGLCHEIFFKIYRIMSTEFFFRFRIFCWNLTDSQSWDEDIFDNLLLVNG